MKELKIEDCQFVSAGFAPVIVGAVAGAAYYVGNSMISGEKMTWESLGASAIGGAIGGGIGATMKAGAVTASTLSALGGGMGEGLYKSTSQGIKNSIGIKASCNQSGSDYGDGCDYQ
ncbi:hypothetical protein [Mannheimia haemolytica]|uniref:hypothetical protein n=1 Tax=Mannheimia haemolytica TaxID=75985 RepID=UPI0001BCFD7C|nr:hypothetical protein [Mannheimia haemolytica]EEY11767.1 hypothetical protein COK_2137 [Mannheimia haemolytica serotype A2 str. BOVINE]MDW0724257.1 hypothetical protein [Mannheimia haemolytica]MDW0737580.1 hypothetical protein [Mannheimia haemolytica]